jgi:hypothetical protein
MNMPWKDNSDAARISRMFIIILLCVTLLLFLIVLSTSLYALGDMWNRRHVTGMVKEVLGPLYIFLVIFGSIPMALWLQRTCFNLERMGFRLRISALFSIIGWFIMFANLVLPYLSLQDAWDGTAQGWKRITDSQGRKDFRWPLVWVVCFNACFILLIFQDGAFDEGGEMRKVSALIQPLCSLLAVLAMFAFYKTHQVISAREAVIYQWYAEKEKHEGSLDAEPHKQ